MKRVPCVGDREESIYSFLAYVAKEGIVREEGGLSWVMKFATSSVYRRNSRG